jgi:ElaB/YqjD/DUF883 family membrane-anchored ribosome-binding protein
MRRGIEDMATGGRFEGPTSQPNAGEAKSSTTTQAGGERSEFDSLRQQVSDLTTQVQQYLSGPASAVLKGASEAAGGVMSGVSTKGREAMEGVQEVKDNLAGAIDTSLKNRPYTTLAVAFGVGFLIARLS